MSYTVNREKAVGHSAHGHVYVLWWLYTVLMVWVVRCLGSGCIAIMSSDKKKKECECRLWPRLWYTCRGRNTVHPGTLPDWSHICTVAWTQSVFRAKQHPSCNTILASIGFRCQHHLVVHPPQQAVAWRRGFYIGQGGSQRDHATFWHRKANPITSDRWHTFCGHYTLWKAVWAAAGCGSTLDVLPNCGCNLMYM